ncbi:molybdenum cofactor guanylyltransferase [Herbiconiux solani]|uniref:molybdenum cofactor guanylyltransferase n=1 Tax=Herbiconiux solani TaxID=661329 RepID=UPI001471611B|nr:NTP transferase domain-containing protein [Herbiconiux solani]
MAEVVDQGVPDSAPAVAAATAAGADAVGGFSLDAVVLAGGRASRLGGRDKPLLERNGRSLLARTVDALRRAGAHRIVVVRSPVPGLGPDVVFARESPPFAGPAAGAAAGVDALAQPAAGASHCFVVASDLPSVGLAVSTLLDAASTSTSTSTSEGADGWIAVDGSGHRQQLLLLLRTDSLRRAIAANGGAAGLADQSMRRLLAGLDLVEVALPDDAVSDIDTPEAALHFGYGDPVTPRGDPSESHPSRPDRSTS